MTIAGLVFAACLLGVGAAVVVAIGYLWAVADTDPQDEE